MALPPDWKPRSIADPAYRSGCEAVAKEIQGQIGGEIKRITPADPNAGSLGPYRGTNPRWSYHEVVVKDGRAYDAFTGSQGLPIDEYKALWLYRDAINFGF